MRTIITSLCLSTAVLFGTASQTTAATVDFYGRSLDSYQWQTVGNNPCNGTELCTDEWALDQAEKNGVFPPAVAEQFRRKLARGDAPTESQVCPGEQFFISFVKNGLARFTPFAEADFTDGQCRTTKEWYVTDPATGWMYRYFVVLECGNKGGGIMPYLSDPVTIDPLLTGYSSGDDGEGCLCDVVPPSFGFGGYFEEGSQVADNNDDPETLDPSGKVPAIALPATLPLLFIALGALAWLRRRYVV